MTMIIDETKIIYFDEEVGIEFKDATIRKGDFYFEIYSSLEDSIYITYEVSNLINHSTLLPFKMETVLPPAKSGEISFLSRNYPIDDYHFDFNGMGYKTLGDNSSALSDDTINSYVTHLSARIQYSGLKKTLSIETVLDDIPALSLNEVETRQIKQGKKIQLSSLQFIKKFELKYPNYSEFEQICAIKINLL